MASDFEERVRLARQRQAESSARAKQEAREREAAAREHEEQRAKQAARPETLETTVRAVASALAARDVWEGAVFVLTTAGRLAADRIPANDPGDPLSGPSLFGIPNFWRDRARRRVATRHRTRAWKLANVSPRDPRLGLFVTAEAELVEGDEDATTALLAADGTYVKVARELNLERVASDASLCESLLDRLAGLVARHGLDVNL